MYQKIKNYYNAGLWNKEMVKNAVKKNKITEYEYESIVGEKY